MSSVKQNGSREIKSARFNGLLQETGTDLPGDALSLGSGRPQNIDSDFQTPGQAKNLSDIWSNLHAPQVVGAVAPATSSSINPTPALRDPPRHHRSPSIFTPPQPGSNRPGFPEEARFPVTVSPVSSPSPAIPPGVFYHVPISFSPSPAAPSSGPSAYFSPPVSWVPAHLRRGHKSAHGCQSPSILQEWFSADNSPAYNTSHLTPGTNLTELEPERDREPDQYASQASKNPLLKGRSRLKGKPATWTDHDGTEVKFPSLVAWHLTKTCSPEDAETALSDLLHATAKGDVDQDWIQALRSSEGLLYGLFRLSDMITPVESLLDSKSSCAKIIDLLLKYHNVDDILTQVHGSDMGGVTGLRYLICKARSAGSPPGESYDAKPKNAWAPDIAVHHAYRIADWSGVDSLSMIPAIRLVESALPSVHTLDRLQQPIYRTFLEAVIHLIKNKEHFRRGEQTEVDPARRTAALHLVSSTLRTYKSILDRLEGDSDTPKMPNKEWILQDLGIPDIVPYLRDENSHPFVRCMALRVLRDFADADVDEVLRWGQLQDVLTICVDVLLWQTKWQHGHEATAKSLDIAKFCPHDDAYRIITLSPAELVIPILSKKFEAVDKPIALLEPLLSLIVDHSKLKDKYWPFMLSMLLHSGCLSVFHEILLQPFPSEKDPLYRTTCRAKAEACIGLTRCVEQMRAKDVKLIPLAIAATLVKLANDETLPSNLLGRASDAFEALRENIVTSLEIRSQVLTHSNDSVAQSTHSNSTSSKKYQSNYVIPPTTESSTSLKVDVCKTSPLAHVTREPQLAIQSMPKPEPGPIEEEQKPGALDRTRTRPLAEATNDPYLSPPSTANPWTPAPQDVQPPTFQTGAAAAATSPSTISEFDNNSKTPPIIFEPISSDRFSLYIPRSPGPGYQSVKVASPASPSRELQESGELVDDEGPAYNLSWPVSDDESEETRPVRFTHRLQSIADEDKPALSLPLPLLRYHLHPDRNHR
ncbi:hypothetical protein FS837_002202 [Tulasnella sp. UAMH 9824]|nr:hypothetical protein FS837_002202 [Tulasnella sp. UAMH 9824]